MGLERFLHRLVAQPKLASDKIVLEFLTVENGWDEKVEATDYVKKSGKKSIRPARKETSAAATRKKGRRDVPGV